MLNEMTYDHNYSRHWNKKAVLVHRTPHEAKAVYLRG